MLVGDAKLAYGAGVGLLRHGDDAQAFGIEGRNLLADLCHALIGERLGMAVNFYIRADLEHFLGGALSDHLRLALFVGDHHAQAAARKIEGNLVDLGVAPA